MKKAVVSAALAVLVVSGCGVPRQGASTVAPTFPPSDGETRVTYVVEGGKSANSITYTTDGAVTTSQLQKTSLPWKQEVVLSEFPHGFSITVQNGGSGKITCKVLDSAGKVLKEATSQGQYAIAACSGSV